MEHTDLLKLDTCQITRARARARRKNPAGGLGYLLERIRHELAERWAPEDGGEPGRAGPSQAEPSQAEPSQAEPSQVLLLDFDGARPHLGEAVTIRQVSPLESPAASPAHFLVQDAGAFDGVVIGLQMAWLELAVVLAEALRVLRPGGRLLFCTFGPDTLQQLRWAWGEVDEAPHVHPFIDMHLIGDQLLQCGFVRPIVDVDRVTVEYENAGILYADLRGEGFTNVLRARRKTLTGKARFDGFAKALDGLREPGAPLAITYELIYGVATAPSLPASQIRVAPPKTASNRFTVAAVASLSPPTRAGAR